VVLGQIVHAYVHSEHLPESWTTEDGGEGEGGGGTAAAVKVEGAEKNKEGQEVVVPAQVAVPFHYVTTVVLGMPCVLTAAATDLWNWTTTTEGEEEKDTTTTIEPAAASSSSSSVPSSATAASAIRLDNPNLRLVSTLTGTAAEKWFHLIPCAMHALAGPTVKELLLVPQLLNTLPGWIAVGLLFGGVAIVPTYEQE
jgi:hypothetical protein